MRRITASFTALILLMSLCACKSTAARWQEQYELGVRYLSEGNYAEAVIAFSAAIEIEEKYAEAYFGRGQAYYGLVPMVENNESFENLPDLDSQKDPLRYCYEQAIRDYERAIELAPDVAEYYDEIMRIALEYGDIELMIRYGGMKYENVDDDGLRDLYESARTSFALMDELAEAFAAGEDDDIFALMQGDSYQALLSLQEHLGRPILREYHGKTLGIYRVDDDKYGHCMLYFGDIADGIRSGSGAWYGYYDKNNYASHGDWSDDAPNGLFDTKEWNSMLSENVVYRLVSGQVTNGLWDGEVLWAFEMEDRYRSWNCTFTDGAPIIVKTEEGGDGIKYVWSEHCNEEDGYLTSRQGEENILHGIAGFVTNH